MLQENVSLTALWEWFITSYPGSLGKVKENPDYFREFITN
jgi:hypothetical protein